MEWKVKWGQKQVIMIVKSKVSTITTAAFIASFIFTCVSNKLLLFTLLFFQVPISLCPCVLMLAQEWWELQQEQRALINDGQLYHLVTEWYYCIDIMEPKMGGLTEDRITWSRGHADKSSVWWWAEHGRHQSLWAEWHSSEICRDDEKNGMLQGPAGNSTWCMRHVQKHFCGNRSVGDAF